MQYINRITYTFEDQRFQNNCLSHISNWLVMIEHFGSMSLMKMSKCRFEDKLRFLTLDILLGKFLLVLLNGIEWFFNVQWFYGDKNILSLAITNKISSTFTNLDILYINEERFAYRFQFLKSKSSHMARNKFYILVIFAFSWRFSVWSKSSQFSVYKRFRAIRVENKVSKGSKWDQYPSSFHLEILTP